MSQIYEDGQHELLRYLPEMQRSSRVIGVNKFGVTGQTGGDREVIWPYTDVGSGIWLAPTEARTHSIVSTSAFDNPASTGAWTLRITGLVDWDTPEVSEEFILDGQTPQNTDNQYVIINRMEVLTSGGINGSPNSGAITATAAVDLTVTAVVPIARGQTLQAVYGIPSTQVMYVTGFYGSSLKENQVQTTSYSDFFLTWDGQAHLRANVHDVTKMQLGMSTAGTNPFQHQFYPYNRFKGPGIMKLEASNPDGQTASGGFDAILIDR